MLEETNYKSAVTDEDPNEAENRFENIAEFVSAAHEFENKSRGRPYRVLENIALVSDIDRMEEDNSRLNSQLHL